MGRYVSFMTWQHRHFRRKTILSSNSRPLNGSHLYAGRLSQGRVLAGKSHDVFVTPPSSRLRENGAHYYCRNILHQGAIYHVTMSAAGSTYEHQTSGLLLI